MCLQIFDIFVTILHLITFFNNNQLIFPDTVRLSKIQLQNYTQKNNLDPPVFTVKTKRPPFQFKATVVIDGKSFESSTFFDTVKEAEQAAAKIALMELPISVDIFQKASLHL